MPAAACSLHPHLEVDGTVVDAPTFLGSPAHGVAYFDGGCGSPHLTPPPTAGSSRALRCWRSRPESVDQFAFGFYPRLRAVAEVTSSDGSFTPPEITGPKGGAERGLSRRTPIGPELVLVISVGDEDFRIPVGSGENNGVRDLDAEDELGCDIDAPVGTVRSARRRGALTDTILDGADTMRFATELQPLLPTPTASPSKSSAGPPITARPGNRCASVSAPLPGRGRRLVRPSRDGQRRGQKIPLPQLLAAITAGADYLLLG